MTVAMALNDGKNDVSTDVPWWRRGVVYQVYPRSFADGNGDGTGDVVGITSKLPYLAELGIDAVWMSPWYTSPLNDGGYDVADYRNIEARYGTLADAEAMIARAHELGIRVITDLVPNHTSSEHVWFQEALASEPGSAARNRYHFRPGKGDDGNEPPTNWVSVFGGPAWSRVTEADGTPGEWYLHLFDPTQPDLNWTNPEVREEFCSILRFWLDRGIDGFRVDVAHGLAKDMSFPDVVMEGSGILVNSKSENHPHWDRDDVHPIIQEWRSVLNEYEGDRMMVAEAWVRNERLPLYVRDNEYHQSFFFDFLASEWDAGQFRQIIDESLTAARSVDSTVTWVISNHDVVRHSTRYGLPHGTDWRAWLLDGPHDQLDAGKGAARARAAVLLTLGLPGSTYLYQGEELGLPEVWDLPTEVLDDPVWEQSGRTRKGRDGCRVPIPWTADGASFGFVAGEATAPWLPMPEAFGGLSAEAQTGAEGSSLELYRAALNLRTAHLIDDEDLMWLDAPSGVIAFERGTGVQVWVNVSGAPVALPEGSKVLVASDEGVAGTLTLAPDQAVWLTR